MRRAAPASASPSRRERLRSQLADLKMPGALEALDDVLRRCDSGQLAPGRRHSATARRAHPDCSFEPSLKREQIESLHTLGFLERKENVVLLGPPGVGKTHLALSLAIAAAEPGRRVYFTTLADLLHSLEDAQDARPLAHRLRTLVFPSLMIIDEIG